MEIIFATSLFEKSKWFNGWGLQGYLFYELKTPFNPLKINFLITLKITENSTPRKMEIFTLMYKNFSSHITQFSLYPKC